MASVKKLWESLEVRGSLDIANELNAINLEIATYRLANKQPPELTIIKRDVLEAKLECRGFYVN